MSRKGKYARDIIHCVNIFSLGFTIFNAYARNCSTKIYPRWSKIDYTFFTIAFDENSRNKFLEREGSLLKHAGSGASERSRRDVMLRPIHRFGRITSFNFESGALFSPSWLAISRRCSGSVQSFLSNYRRENGLVPPESTVFPSFFLLAEKRDWKIRWNWNREFASRNDPSAEFYDLIN